MKTRREKKFAKLLKRLAECNVNVPFLYNNEGKILADNKYSGYQRVEDLSIPEGYTALDLLNSDGKCSCIIDYSEKPVASITMVDSGKVLNDDIFDGYREYTYEASTVGNFFRKTTNKIKNGIKYLFTRRSNASNDFVNEILNRPLTINHPEETVPTNIEVLDEKLLESNEPKKEVVKETKKEQPKKEEPKVNPEKSKKDKYNEFIEKYYLFMEKEAFDKLGEYEKMFIEDAKAECLDPSDNEFRQMLNERAVNKEVILNYYAQLEINRKNKELEHIKVDFEETKNNLKEAYDNLGDFERMFVDDALADSLELEDNEFRQMLSERTVNKNQVLSFMKLYKDNLNEQKLLIDTYTKLSETDKKDYSVYTINELRKELAANKSMLTKQELEKHNASTLKKSEIIELMNRIDSKKQEQELTKLLNL